MKPNFSIIVIRAVQELTGLDEPERITVTMTRRKGRPSGKVKLSLSASQKMMKALERAGWQVNPSLRGGFSWTARPQAYASIQALVAEHEVAQRRAVPFLR